MSLSNSPGAYSDCRALMEAAILDPRGIRVRMADEAAAIYFRMRCNQCRSLDRKANAETYEKGHPLHDTSDFDKIVMRIVGEDNAIWLYMEQNNVIPGKVESLSGAKVQLELPILNPAPKQLPPPPRETPPTEQELGDAFAEIEAVDGEVLPPEPKSGLRRL